MKHKHKKQQELDEKLQLAMELFGHEPEIHESYRLIEKGYQLLTEKGVEYSGGGFIFTEKRYKHTAQRKELMTTLHNLSETIIYETVLSERNYENKLAIWFMHQFHQNLAQRWENFFLKYAGQTLHEFEESKFQGRWIIQFVNKHGYKKIIGDYKSPIDAFIAEYQWNQTIKKNFPGEYLKISAIDTLSPVHRNPTYFERILWFDKWDSEKKNRHCYLVKYTGSSKTGDWKISCENQFKRKFHGFAATEIEDQIILFVGDRITLNSVALDLALDTKKSIESGKFTPFGTQRLIRIFKVQFFLYLKQRIGERLSNE